MREIKKQCSQMHVLFGKIPPTCCSLPIPLTTRRSKRGFLGACCSNIIQYPQVTSYIISSFPLFFESSSSSSWHPHKEALCSSSRNDGKLPHLPVIPTFFQNGRNGQPSFNLEELLTSCSGRALIPPDATSKMRLLPKSTTSRFEWKRRFLFE